METTPNGLALGMAKTKAELQHWSGDTFRLELPVVDQQTNGFAEFQFSSGGELRSIRLEAMEPGDIGEFTIKR